VQSRIPERTLDVRIRVVVVNILQIARPRHVVYPDIELLIAELVFKLLLEVCHRHNDTVAGLSQSVCWRYRAICLDLKYEVGLQRMRDFVARKNDGFVLKKVGAEEIGEGVVLLEYFEGCRIWYFSVLNHFNPEIV
jgi:hypothetical protein